MTQEAVIDTPVAAPPPDTGPDRGDLIKAANAAEASEEPAAPVEEKKAKKAEAPKEEEELPRLASVLRAREKAQGEREEAGKIKSEAEAMRREVQEMHAQAKQDRADAAKELARYQGLKSDPMRAIKEIGWAPDDLVNHVVKAGTPEHQMFLKQQAQMEAQQTALDELKAFREEHKQLVEQQKEQQFRQDRQAVVGKFIVQVKDECPTLYATYPEELIVMWGDKVADDYRAKTGQSASLSDIAQYLEHEVKTRLGKSATSPKAGATPQRANGPRTLSNAAASERRSAPKALHDLSPSEERDALKAAAEEAMQAER